MKHYIGDSGVKLKYEKKRRKKGEKQSRESRVAEKREEAGINRRERESQLVIKPKVSKTKSILSCALQ